MTYDPNSGWPYPPQPTPPPKNRVGKILGIGCGGVLALALFGGCVAAISSGSDDDKDQSASSSVTAKPEASTPKPKKSTKSAKPKPKEYSDGDYEVGVDIEPGTYVSEGAKSGLFDFCQATTKPTDESFGEWETANAGERVILKVTANSGIVSISGCEPFVRR